jgi:hypothetical protein
MSSSKSSSTARTSNTDNRVTADGSSIAIGTDGTYINEFPEEVADFAHELTNIVKASVATSDKAVKTSIEGLQAVTQREQSSALFAQDLLKKVTPIALIAGVTFIGYAYFVKGKR